MKMNLLRLVYSYLKAKLLNTILNGLLLSLGIAIITVILLFSKQLQEKIESNSKGIDLVVGAKGSPLQLILCSVFHIDFPTGNINLREAEKLSQHRLVKSAIPMALGDSYQGYRIVGTSQDYVALYSGALADGVWWQHDFEVTLGWQVAENLKLKTGDTFISTHGMSTEGHAHDENKFVVKSIIMRSNSVIDNLIFTTIPSIWKMHEEHHDDTIKRIEADSLSSNLIAGVSLSDSTREITSLLIKYRNPIAALQLPRYINGQTNMQAASPAFESARLFTILGVGVKALNAFAYVLIFVAALSIFIALYNSLKERKYDLAIMRSMGASRGKLLVVIVLEGIALTAIGSLVGLGLGHLILFFFTQVMEEGARAGMTAGVFYQEEYFIFAGSLALGVLCSLLPAIQAYRTDIHKILAGN